MKQNFSRNKYIKVISFLLFLCVFLTAFAAVNAINAKKYKAVYDHTSQQAISELCENLDSITVSLQKSLYTNSEPMLLHYGSELSKSAACAKVSLGTLTEKEMMTSGIYKFLSQVGEYTFSLDRKLQSGKALSKKERENMQKLYEFAVSLSKGLGDVRDGYYNNTVTFEKISSTLKSKEEELPSLFSDSVNDAQQSFADYPTLLYDGPFADSLQNSEAVFVKDKDNISLEQARKIAASAMLCRGNQLRRDSDEESGIDLFCFSLAERAVAVTKKGGYLCYMTNPYYSTKAEIDEKSAVKIAKEFLKEFGYESMKESYYSNYDGVCTVNFAYSKNGVVHYPDLIKVSVALDSAKVVGIDARGYLMNHRERSFPKAKISLSNAKKQLSPSLTVLNEQIALIPTNDGKEKLCYEFHCKDSAETEVLIYVDVETGVEDDIKILLYSDDGTVCR